MPSHHQARVVYKRTKKLSVHYVDLIPEAIKLMRSIYGAGKGLHLEFIQSAFYKDIIVKVRDSVAKFMHVIVIKLSERYAVPPSLFETFIEREWRRLQRLLNHEELRRADFTIFIAGQLTKGVTKLSYVTKRLSGKTCLVYALQTKHRTLKSVLKRIVSVIQKYYETRLSAIRQKINRLKERGLSDTEIDRLEISQLATLLRAILLILPQLKD